MVRQDKYAKKIKKSSKWHLKTLKVSWRNKKTGKLDKQLTGFS
jgi:hypothetical protein